MGTVNQPSGRFIWKWELVIGYGTLSHWDAREQASADTELSSNLQAKNYFGGTCSLSKYGGVTRERLGVSAAPGAHRGVGVGALHVPPGDSQAVEKTVSSHGRSLDSWIVADQSRTGTPRGLLGALVSKTRNERAVKLFYSEYYPPFLWCS